MEDSRRPRSRSPSLSPRRENDREPSPAREDLMELIRDALVTGKLATRDLEDILNEFDFGKQDSHSSKPQKQVYKKYLFEQVSRQNQV